MCLEIWKWEEAQTSFFILIHQSTNLLSALFLLWGTLVFVGKKPVKGWIYVSLTALVWMVMGWLLEFVPVMLILPNVILIGLIYASSGVNLLCHHVIAISRKRIIGWCLILLGIHQWDYPLIYFLPALAPWGYLIGSILKGLIALGLVMLAFDKLNQELRDREGSYRLLFESAHDSILFVDPFSGRILEANPAALCQYGYTREEMLQMYVYELRAVSERPLTAQNLSEADRQGVVFETLHCRKDGSTIPVEVSSRGVTIGSKRILFSVVRDISERIILAREKERLAVTLRSICEGVITTDIKGKVVLLNKVAEQLTGWSQQEAEGKNLEEVYKRILEETEAPYSDPFQAVLSSRGMILSSSHHILVDRLGDKRLITDSGAPIFDADSNIIGVVLVFRDVTEEQKMKEELLRANKLESLSLLAGGVAHDFNNLFTSLIGNLSLLKSRGTGNEEVNDAILDFEQATLRAKGLTQQLLTFAKGGAPIKKNASITELIKESTDFALRGSKINCVYGIAADLWSVEIDEGQIYQVINNLAYNAKQAMANGGTLEVKVENIILSEGTLPLKKGKYIRITVKDEGEGISKENIEKIFDPYFTTKTEGTGLGLAICYSVIKQHHGHIEVTSQKGQGTTFSIYLPAALQCPAAKAVTAVTSGEGKILLMDDEELVRRVAGRILRYLGYTVEFAKNGAEAMVLYQRELDRGESFDVVIMDLTIQGGLGGVDTIRQLVKIDPRVKAIVSSGYSTDPVMANYKDYGFCGVITKPYQLSEVSETLQRVQMGEGI